MLGQQAAGAERDSVGETWCWREAVLQVKVRAIIWFLLKRGKDAVGITEVEYITLSEVRNVMWGIVWGMTIPFQKGG